MVMVFGAFFAINTYIGPTARTNATSEEASMKDKQDTDTNSNPEQGAAFASRRTIMKGLAATVPVVMTIGCGQAMANASSLQCIEALRQERPTNCIDVEDRTQKTSLPKNPDEWLRKTVNIKNPNKTPVYKSCLVTVDQNGIPKTTGQQIGPVTLSCYASFTPV